MRSGTLSMALTGIIILVLARTAGAADQVPEQTRFDSPEAALQALLAATKARDQAQLRQIFGVNAHELSSGDERQDQADLEQFAANLATAAKLVPENPERMTLQVGPNAYPFPFPLVRQEGEWLFDTQAGLEELLNRRIGENEIKSMTVCRGYVAAQRDYYARDWDDDGVIEYAQRIASTPGKKDGLFWPTAEDEPPSPLGPLVAEARAEGYGSTQPATPATQPAASRRPYHGYVYKILKRQGEHAPGGKFDYVINGHMVAGFALVAWPANWGKSGVMTFVVNTNGRVYEKDLGEKTAEIAAHMDTYDPDESWHPCQE